MAITANNIVVTGQVQTAEQPVKTADEQKMELAPGGNSTKLVVNGKVKNISKKSAFLLDMLTLDDE